MKELCYNLTQYETKKLFATITIEEIHLKNGDILFEEYDQCEKLAYVVNGTIIAKQNFSDGHDCILKVLSKGDFIGINLIFSSNPQYKASFYSKGDSTIKVISREDLLKLMENKVVKENVLARISDCAIELNEHIKLLNHRSIRSKFCYYLYTQYQQNDSLEFRMNISKTNLAALLNVERPSLSFEVKKLIREGVIKNKNKDYTILDLNKILKEI